MKVSEICVAFYFLHLIIKQWRGNADEGFCALRCLFFLHPASRMSQREHNSACNENATQPATQPTTQPTTQPATRISRREYRDENVETGLLHNHQKPTQNYEARARSCTVCELSPKTHSLNFTHYTIFKKGVANCCSMDLYSPHENVTANITVNITESVAENLSVNPRKLVVDSKETFNEFKENFQRIQRKPSMNSKERTNDVYSITNQF